MVATGGWGGSNRWPVRVLKKEKGKHSTGGGCGDSGKRWWQC